MEIATEITLEPCPFCGVDPVLKTESTLGVAYYWVKCTNPKCSASPAASRNQQDAIEGWNRRG